MEFLELFWSYGQSGESNKNDMCLTPRALAVSSPKGQLVLVLPVKEKCQHKPALQECLV